MPKSGLILILLCALLLAACTPAAAPAATATTPPQPTVDQTAVAALPAMTCSLVSALPTPGPTEASLYPPVTEQDWVLGPADAKITILEYSDFQ